MNGVMFLEQASFIFLWVKIILYKFYLVLKIVNILMIISAYRPTVTVGMSFFVVKFATKFGLAVYACHLITQEMLSAPSNLRILIWA